MVIRASFFLAAVDFNGPKERWRSSWAGHTTRKTQDESCMYKKVRYPRLGASLVHDQLLVVLEAGALR